MCGKSRQMGRPIIQGIRLTFLYWNGIKTMKIPDNTSETGILLRFCKEINKI